MLPNTWLLGSPSRWPRYMCDVSRSSGVPSGPTMTKSSLKVLTSRFNLKRKSRLWDRNFNTKDVSRSVDRFARKWFRWSCSVSYERGSKWRMYSFKRRAKMKKKVELMLNQSYLSFIVKIVHNKMLIWIADPLYVHKRNCCWTKINEQR